MKVRKPTGALDLVNLWVCEMAGAESDFDDDDGWMDVVHMNFLWDHLVEGKREQRAVTKTSRRDRRRRTIESRSL